MIKICQQTKLEQNRSTYLGCEQTIGFRYLSTPNISVILILCFIIPNLGKTKLIATAKILINFVF